MDVILSAQDLAQVMALVPLAVGLVEVIKRVGLPSQYAPVSSLIIGIALAFLVMPTGTMVVLGGIAVGLMASGLYSGTRTMSTGQ